MEIKVNEGDYNFPLEFFNDENTSIPSNYKICLAISSSVKHILWYLPLKGKNMIFSMECNEMIKVPPYNNEPYLLGETISSLLNETKLMGTIIPSTKNDVNFFLIEDIGIFRGKNIQNCTFSEKILYINELIILHSKIEDFTGIILVIPFFWENGVDIPYDEIPYLFDYIQYRTLNDKDPYLNIRIQIEIPSSTINTIDYRQIFEVKSTLQSDIYELYAYDKKKQSVFYDIAYIPNCKSSMYMNILFMEETSTTTIIDDYLTDVFENKKIDTKKTLIMECVYHVKFQRWVPIKVLHLLDNNRKIILLENLPLID